METGPNRTLRLLAVDDDAASAELVVRVAERCGFEAFATSDSRGVVNLVRALKPEIMAVDICMPNIDALELFKLLAADGYSGRILIVSGQEDHVLQAARNTAIDLGLVVPCIIQKPLDFRKLREMLASSEVQLAAGSA